MQETIEQDPCISEKPVSYVLLYLGVTLAATS